MNAPDRLFTTPAPPAPAASLQAWQQRLANVRLPLLSSPLAVQRMLGSRLSVRDLVELVEADLPLAVDLMLAASASLRRSGKPLQGLQHAVNLLGVERVQSRVRTLQNDRLDLAQPGHRLARQAMATSRLACLFTNHWAARHAGSDPEALIWTTALLGVVRWKLPLAAPDVATELERWVASGQRRATAERALLGCTLDALSSAHLGALGMDDGAAPHAHRAVPPKLLAHAARLDWSGPVAPELPSHLQRPLRQPEVTCSLALGLAQSVQDSWYSRHTRSLMAAAAVHTQQPLDRLRAELVQLALHASHETSFNQGLVAPAARLLWAPPVLRSVWPKAQAKAQRAVQAQAQVATSMAPQQGTAAYQQRCQQGQHSDLRALMKDTVDTLEKQLGLQRCALFLKAAGSDQLNCPVAQGFGAALTARGLTLPAGDTHLLARLLKQRSASLCVTAAQVPAARQQLPPALAPLLLASGVALGTVDMEQQPMGIWWADTGEAEHALDGARYAAFQQLVRGFGTAFTQLAKARKPAR